MKQDPKQTAVIVGGRSDIGLALARRLARAGHPIVLAARRAGELAEDAADIALRHGVDVRTQELDVLKPEGYAAFLERLPADTGIVACVVGLLPDQQAVEGNPQAAQQVVDTNFTGPLLLLELAARRLAASGAAQPAVIGIGSVAGDRGRARNYWYGAAKAAFAAGLSGLRQRHARTPLLVMTVKPGFVRTRMTAGMDLPPALTDTPEQLAELIHRALRRRRMVVVPWKWRLVMAVIRLIPERVFSRMTF